MAVGLYSPRRIGNSRIVPTVLTHHLQSSPVFRSPCPSSAVLTRHLQFSPVSCRARQSPTEPVRHLGLPGELHHLRHLQSPPVPLRLSSGQTPRYPSRAPFQVPPSVPSGPEDGRTGRLGTLLVVLDLISVKDSTITILVRPPVHRSYSRASCISCSQLSVHPASHTIAGNLAPCNLAKASGSFFDAPLQSSWNFLKAKHSGILDSRIWLLHTNS